MQNKNISERPGCVTTITEMLHEKHVRTVNCLRSIKNVILLNLIIWYANTVEALLSYI